MTRIILLLALVLSAFAGQAQGWEPKGDTPFIRDHTNAFGIDGKAYVIQGANDDDDANYLWEYTADTDTWVQLDDFPGEKRGLPIGDDWNGKYYYGFGFGSQGALSDLWVFDPADMSFTELPSCPCEGRAHPAFVAHNEKIYMGAGSGDNGDLNDWWVYDMLTQEWTEKDGVPGEVRHHPYQFGIDSMIYVGGGHVENWSGFNINTEEWIGINSYPEGRVAGTQFSYNGKGYALSGDDADHGEIPEADTFLEYDPELDEWDVRPGHPGGNRWACSHFIIDGYVYLFGGYPLSGGDAKMWRFFLGTEVMSGADDLRINNELIDVFPNPLQDKIILDFGDEIGADYSLEIFDAAGKRVYYAASVNDTTLDLSFLNKGIYLANFKSGATLVTKKLVKE